MSNRCHILCRECDEETGDINHGQVVLANVLKAKTEIVALYESPAKGEIAITLDPWRSAVEVPFFIYEHREHTLVIMDEYGAEYDEDGVRLDVKKKSEGATA